MGKLVLGLDIGITSVGWGIIDISTNKIIDYGVRLFKEGTAAENEKRRIKRSGRRLKRRKQNRLNDFKNILMSYNLIDDQFIPLPNPYEIRVKGLNEKLSNEELATALLHIVKRRGTTLDTVSETEDDEENANVLMANDKLIKEGKYICEIQLLRLQENNGVRGHSNNFKTKDYINEVEKILSNQNLPEEFTQIVTSYISRKRAFDEGPGSEKSPTPYGRYLIENGELKKINLIDKMRGKCSIYPTELRAPKLAYSAELFNLLNDLNNLTIENRKITEEEKTRIIDFVNDKGGVTIAQLYKLLGVDKSHITGFRINKSGKPIITEFKGFKAIKNILDGTEYDKYLNNADLLDTIADVLTKTKNLNDRKLGLEELGVFDAITIEKLANAKGFTGYHSLSLRAITELNEEMIAEPLNQQQIITMNQLHSNRVSHEGEKWIKADDEAILSPVTKRSIREAIKVVNRVRELYGELDSIVVEMAREKNSEEQKKIQKNIQEANEKRNKSIDELLQGKEVSNTTRLKITLYQQQDGKDVYSLQDIDLKKLIEEPTYYEIDHILPISVSLDDSMANKVLVTHKSNQLKGQNSPLGAFRNKSFAEYDEKAFKAYVNGLRFRKLINKKKSDYLLFDKDVSKYDDMEAFINRNLVDTRYACRVVLNTLQDYYEDNDINTKVHVINGSATAAFRGRAGIKKDRDENYGHHAIDAIIIATVKKNPRLNSILMKQNFSDLYNEDTGELNYIKGKDEYLDPMYIEFLTTLRNIQVTKFSHKIDSKPNRQIADETIYSTRIVNGEEKVVKKYSNIYDARFAKLTEDILNNTYQDKYLMYKNDPQTFAIIEKIVRDYYEANKSDKKIFEVKEKNKKSIITLKGENPLSVYKNEFGSIRKYSKKNNGPEITSMKYLEDKLGNHISITHKYDVKDKNVVLLQISPYRTDFYLSQEGLYKFVTVRYKDVAYSKTKDKYVIDEKWYTEEKEKKGIDDTYTFQFSLHRDELVGITKAKGEKLIISDDSSLLGVYSNFHDGIHPELLKFTATNNDNTNQIEVKPIDFYYKKQALPAIGSKVIKMDKYVTDVLGNLYKVEKSSLKLEFD